MNPQNKAIFLDRDGVINHDPGDYTQSLDEFHILPGVIDHIKKWYDQGYKIIVITNQGGIAKGLYNEHAVHAMHQYLQGKCIEAECQIEAFYFCEHHPDYSGKCLCRKPGSLMIEKAIHQFNIDPKQSIMYGDRQRDIDCAQAAGVKGVLIETNSVNFNG